MVRSLLVVLPLAAGLSLAACAETGPAVYRSTTEKNTLQLLPVATDIARAKGYTLAGVTGDSHAVEFVAFEPDLSAAMLVEIKPDSFRQGRALECFGFANCGTWLSVTPLSISHDHLAVWADAPAGLQEQARDLVTAIGDQSR